MPELPEVERYRTVAESALGRVIAEVRAFDAWYLKRGASQRELAGVLEGARFWRARRTGKLLLLDVDTGKGARPPSDGPVLGLHFGMSGTLLVDAGSATERATEDQLAYSSHKVLPGWDRFALRFEDGGEMRVNDARRLGGVELDPDPRRLGPDALGLSLSGLRAQLGSSSTPLKARLMDQSRLAGVGNLIADEALWRAGLDPRRSANSLDLAQMRKLQRHLRKTIDDLILRGGSHHGDLMPARHLDGRCPKDGARLTRGKVGGRTTYWCSIHQI